MSGQLPRKPLPGSNRVAPLHDRMGDPRPGTPATVTVYLRGDEPVPGRLSREEYAAAHGAAAEDIEAVRRFATEHGLRVGDVDPGRRSVEVSGDLGSIAGAFGATLGIYQAPGGDPYRARVGGLSLPPELDGVVTGVFWPGRTSAGPAPLPPVGDGVDNLHTSASGGGLRLPDGIQRQRGVCGAY